MRPQEMFTTTVVLDETSSISSKQAPTVVKQSQKPSIMLERTFGLKPLIPRGQMDITYRPVQRRAAVVVAFALCIAALLFYVGATLLVQVLQIAAALVLLKLSVDGLLTYFIADMYLKSTSSFAKYNSMIRQIFKREQSQNKSAILEQVEALKLSPVSINCESKPSIVITGATGFLGSAILLELLTNDDLMASINKVVVICRPKRGKSALQRVDKLLDQDIFSSLSQVSLKKMIVPLEGDASKPNAGIVAKDMAFLLNEFRIHSVIHCAAAVGFKQTLDQAAAANITSSLYMQQLSQRLSAKLVHVSTAFVHGGLTGTPAAPLPEALFDLEKFDANRIYKSMLGNQVYANQAMSTLHFPNTYTFSKCICEHLLLQRNHNDLAIIRPSIIGPSLHIPFEGWAGHKPSTVVAAVCLYLKFPLSIWCFSKHPAAVIPVDVVARFVLCKTFNGPGPRSEDCSERSSVSGSEFENSSSITEVESLTCKSTSTVEANGSVIFAATWNKDSPATSTLSWFDCAKIVPQMGTILHRFTRITAYIGFVVSSRILPSLRLEPASFALLYRFLVQMPFSLLLRLVAMGRLSGLHANLSKLLPILDLPVLFYPFSNNAFFFESELKAPSDMDGERYMFSCVASAYRFVYEFDSRYNTKDQTKQQQLCDTSNMMVGGKKHRLLTSDLCWAITQPRGNITTRLMCYLFIKILRVSSNAVSVDVESFAVISRLAASSSQRGEKRHVILAPTHRSFYDFALVSFLAFSLPELKIKIPYIAATHELLSSLPFLLGWLIDYAKVFFVGRGRSMEDAELANQIRRMKSDVSKEEGECFEVFLEGTRSRNRRFLKGKTGFLRHLEQTGGDHVVVPICISYEMIPEQQALVFEGVSGRGLRTNRGLVSWLWATLTGKFLPIGDIHISAAKPVVLNSGPNPEYDRLVTEIQEKQQAMVRVSRYHIQAAEYTLKLDQEVVTEALQILGCKFWPSSESSSGASFTAPLPSSSSEGWSTILQFGHLVAPKLKSSHAHWAKWLSPPCRHLPCESKEEDDVSASVTALVEAFEAMFDKTEAAIDQAIAQLKRIHVCRLSIGHAVQVARTYQEEEEQLPVSLLFACASMKVCEAVAR